MVAGNVDGLQAGIYKYRPQGHELEKVAAGDVRAEGLQGVVDVVRGGLTHGDLEVERPLPLFFLLLHRLDRCLGLQRFGLVARVLGVDQGS